MINQMTGGCACRKIRYQYCAEPIVQLICHCRDCQMASGSAFAAILFIANDSLTIPERDLYFHAVVGGSGRVLERGLCRACGSPVLLRWPDNQRVRMLHAASLDDPSLFHPSCEVWTSRADPWHPFHPQTEKFPERPSAEAVRGRIEAFFAKRQQAL